MASWLVYYVWHYLWRILDSIRHYILGTALPADSSKTHRLISDPQPALPTISSAVCLSATCPGSLHTDNCALIKLPRQDPIFPADGSKGDTTIEYVVWYDSKTLTNL